MASQPHRRGNEMLAFEVTVNGKRRYVAGHVDEHFVQLMLWGNNRLERAASINTADTPLQRNDGQGDYQIEIEASE